jgi:hypothetical protein
MHDWVRQVPVIDPTAYSVFQRSTSPVYLVFSYNEVRANSQLAEPCVRVTSKPRERLRILNMDGCALCAGDGVCPRLTRAE